MTCVCCRSAILLHHHHLHHRIGTTEMLCGESDSVGIVQ